MLGRFANVFAFVRRGGAEITNLRIRRIVTVPLDCSPDSRLRESGLVSSDYWFNKTNRRFPKKSVEIHLESSLYFHYLPVDNVLSSSQATYGKNRIISSLSRDILSTNETVGKMNFDNWYIIINFIAFNSLLTNIM